MSARRQFLKAAVECFATGAAAGLVVSAVWLTVTGHTPSLLVSLVAADIVSVVWGAGQAIRFRRKWQRVLASYDQPALGEGIEIPHRPPADEPPYYGHVVDYRSESGTAPECVEDCPGCEIERGEGR